MATVNKTIVTYPLDGATVDFTIPFEYLARKFVYVTLVGDNERKELVINQDYRFATKTTISTLRAWGAADGYSRIELRRHTSATDRLVDFVDGSILRAYDLNVSQIQTLHVAEEGRDQAVELTREYAEEAAESARLAGNSATTAVDAAKRSEEALAESRDNLQRSIRVPKGEAYLRDLPAKADRANKTVSFDNDGNLLVTAPVPGSAENVMIDLAKPDGANKIGYRMGPLATHTTVGEKLGLFVTPEDYSDRVVDGDWAPAINAAIRYARDQKVGRVFGDAHYTIKSPVRVDNAGEGLRLELAGLIVDENWHLPDDWKWSTGAIIVGEESNGSMAGLRLIVGYFHGRDRATLYQLKGFGAGASYFEVGRARNFWGIWENTRSDKFHSNDNTVHIGHGGNGVFGIRIRRGSGSFTTEGTKITGGFIQGCKYGGIQLFNGAQYTTISNIGVDFNGRFLCEYTVDTKTSTKIQREGLITNGTKSCEVLDYGKHLGSGGDRIVVIEPTNVSVPGASTSFNVGDTLTINGWTGKVVSKRVPGTSNFYLDLIHGFEGAAFAKCHIQFSYCGGVTGGLLNTTHIEWWNSNTNYTTIINGIRLRPTETSSIIEDAYRGNLGFELTNSQFRIDKHFNMGANRKIVETVGASVPRTDWKVIRTMSYISTGEEGPEIRNLYRVTVKADYKEGVVGGQFLLYVSPNGCEVRDSTVTPFEVSVSGFQVRVRQGAKDTIFALFQYERI